jgi:hypothetical protein
MEKNKKCINCCDIIVRGVKIEMQKRIDARAELISLLTDIIHGEEGYLGMKHWLDSRAKDGWNVDLELEGELKKAIEDIDKE